MEVNSWAMDGGSRLGTNRTQPKDVKAILATVKKFNLVGMIVIGMGATGGSWCIYLFI